MWLSPSKTWLLSLLLALAAPGVGAGEKEKAAPPLRPEKFAGEGRKATRHDLTPQSFAGLHRLIRAQDNEWQHLKVHWHTDVVAARKKAAREDKPIIIVYTMGAGYNDPLGIC